MKLNSVKPLFLVVLLSFVCFVIHKNVFLITDFSLKETTFKFSLIQIYSFFTISSFLIIAILLIIKKRNFDSVGYAFMGLTTLKIGLSLFLLRPILQSQSLNLRFEKGNFFIIFALFLAIETIVAIQILNNKQ